MESEQGLIRDYMATTEPAGQAKLRFTPQIAAYLDQLVTGGLYGKNRTQVVEMLVRDQIVLLLEKGQLKRID